MQGSGVPHTTCTPDIYSNWRARESLVIGLQAFRPPPRLTLQPKVRGKEQGLKEAQCFGINQEPEYAMRAPCMGI